MRLPSAFESIVIAVQLAMETCMWVAIAEIFDLPHPLVVLFGVPFVVALATRTHRILGAVAIAAVIAARHPELSHLADAENFLGLAFIIRGAVLGLRFTSVAEVRIVTMIGLGTFMLIGTLGWPTAGTPPLVTELAGLTVGFVALGVTASVLLQRAEVEIATLGGRGKVKIGWVAAVLSPFLALLAIAALAAGGGPTIVALVLSVVDRIFAFIGMLISIPAGWFSAFFAWLATLVKAPGKAIADGPPLAMPATNPDKFKFEILHGTLYDLTRPLEIAAIVLVFGLLGFVLLRVKFRRRRRAAFVEERSFAWSWGDLRDSFGRKHAQTAAVEETVPRAMLPVIREIYREVLSALAARGIVRDRSQTAGEFASGLAAVDPAAGAPLAELTAMYECVRYDDSAGDPDHARELAAAIAKARPSAGAAAEEEKVLQ